MFRRTTLCLALLAVAPLARADDKAKPAAPALVVRVQSVEDLLAHARYLGEVTGADEQVRQFEGILKAKTGPKGLEGIDTKRPMAAYAVVGPAGVDSHVVALVPVADEGAFLSLLKNLDIKADKGDDGVYTLAADKSPVPVYLRFANKHACVTVQNKDALDAGRLLAPDVVRGAAPAGLASLALRIDRVPENLRGLLVGQIQQQAEKAGREGDGKDTKAEAAFKKAVAGEVISLITAVLRSGREVAARLDIDRKAGELTLDLTLDGSAGSPLNAGLAGLGRRRSTVAGLVGSGSALGGAVNLAVPEKVLQTFEDLVNEKLGAETREPAHQMAEKFLKALTPSLRMGEIDVAVDLRGPSAADRFTLVAAQKVKDGAGLERAVRDLINTIPEEERKEIQLDLEKVGDITIHRFEAKNADDGFRKAFGDPLVYVAVRDDAVFVAFGEGALPALKAALKTSAAPAPAARLGVAMASVARAVAETQPRTAEAARKAFRSEGDDTVRVTLEGGDALRLRAVVKSAVLRFLAALPEEKP